METALSQREQTQPLSVSLPRWAIFVDVLRFHGRHIVYWGGGGALMAFATVMLIPNAGLLARYQDMVALLPKPIVEAIVGEEVAFLATPEGFLALMFFGWMVLFFAVYAVYAGLCVTAHEEDSGILDVLLTLPITRRRFMLEKLSGYGFILIAMLVMVFVGLWAGAQLIPATYLEIRQLAENVFNILPVSLLIFTMSTFIAVRARRKSHAKGIIIAIVAGAYFITLVGNAVPNDSVFHAISRLSFMSHYSPVKTMQFGVMWEKVAALLGLALVFAVAAVEWFERREID